MIAMNDLFAKYFLENLQDCKHSKKIAQKFISLYAKKIRLSYIENDKSKVYFNANVHKSRGTKQNKNLILEKSAFEDMTSLEMFCNSVHLEEYHKSIKMTSKNAMSVAFYVVVELGDFLKKKFPTFQFCIIASVQTDWDIEKKPNPPFCLTNRVNVRFFSHRDDDLPYISWEDSPYQPVIYSYPIIDKKA